MWIAFFSSKKKAPKDTVAESSLNLFHVSHKVGIKTELGTRFATAFTRFAITDVSVETSWSKYKSTTRLISSAAQNEGIVERKFCRTLRALIDTDEPVGS